jgi:hypothetical protein
MQHASTRTLFRTIALAAALAATAGAVSAQEFVFGWNPRSGDAWVDQRLDDINQYGTRYREPFIDEITRYHGAPRDLVSDLLVRQRWAPGDVYYACAIAHVLGRPCREVVDEWNRDHGQGWGALAQRMGIKPGSPEFHRLKKGFVPTYDRWSRPIVLDDDLRRDFPDRGKDKDNGKRSDKGKTRHAAQDDGRGESSAPGNGKPAGKGNSKGNNGKKG